MSDVQTVNLLIDKAKSIVGSDAAVARALGVVPQRIANWRNGNASCSPEDQALLAAVAGLDPVAELARATVRKHEGSKKGDLLMRALGKASRLTGAVAGSVGALVLVISGLTTPTPTRATEAREIQCVRRRKRTQQSWLCQAVFA